MFFKNLLFKVFKLSSFVLKLKNKKVYQFLSKILRIKTYLKIKVNYQVLESVFKNKKYPINQSKPYIKGSEDIFQRLHYISRNINGAIHINLNLLGNATKTKVRHVTTIRMTRLRFSNNELINLGIFFNSSILTLIHFTYL